MRPQALRRAEPLAALPLQRPADGEAALRWPLQPSALNRLELSCWRWSRLGLGAVGVALLLGLVSLLERLRLAAGFGLPQLRA
jgi:hypothetical protein